MIPILLDKQKSLIDLVNSITGGLGDISGAYEGRAVEEANGLEEISFKLPIDSPRYNDLKVGSYIKAKADDLHELQIYEVYKITRPINGIVTVRAQHISYILGKASVLPFTATGIIPVINAMQNHIVGQYPFTMETDIVNPTNTFALATPMSFRAAIGGWQGSILDIFGGELDWDNLTVKLLAHRGADNGVKIEYGKNLTSLTQEESIAKVYDAVIGFAVVDDVTYVGEIQKITETNSPRTLNVDFSSEFDSEHLPTTQRLNELAMAYAINNDIGKPSVNLKISFELLSKTTEYKNIAVLERTGLFDTVYVSFPKLGVDSKAKVIRTEYDFINEKPISVELGDTKTNLTNLIDEQISQNNLDISNEISSAKKAISVIDEAIAEMNSIITNSLGLFYTRVVKQDGGYQYYLHNKPQLADSQYQWTINAGGFSLSQDYGQTWTAGIDLEGNAVFNSMSANIVKAMQIYGSYIQGSQIVFGDPSEQNAKYITAAPYSVSDVQRGVSFDGTGTIRMRPQEQFVVHNIDGNENILNSIILNKSGSANQPFILFRNYDPVNHLGANFFELDSRYYLSSDPTNIYNRFVINNYDTLHESEERKNGNMIVLESNSTRKRARYANYQIAAPNALANILTMVSTTTYNNSYLQNYKLGSTANSIANIVNLYHSNDISQISIRNIQYIDSSNYANAILLESSSSGKKTSIINYKTDSEGISNSIIMDSANDIMTLYSYNDIYINSDGAVRIYSKNQQDITLNASDDIYMVWNGKLRMNGKNVYLASNGYVMWDNN